MQSDMFYCLVVGTRTFTNYKFLKEKLNHMLQNHLPNVVIVSGGAKGADTLAEKYAKEYNLPLKVFPADWDKYGKAAGPIRNCEMHKYISTFTKRGVVAFWDGKSRGTATNFDIAKKYGNQIVIFNSTSRKDYK